MSDMQDQNAINLDDIDFTISPPDRDESPAAYNRRLRTPLANLAAAVLHSAAELVDRPTKLDIETGLRDQAVVFIKDEQAVMFWFGIMRSNLEEKVC